MIKELISTSAPRCLDGNPGFGIVAQTSGMSQNVSSAVDTLSGYTRTAMPDSGEYPVVYLHTQRSASGKSLHIVSRIADCGNDYSNRENRIAHHFVIDDEDIQDLPGGPANLAAQNIFRTQWNENPEQLPPRKNLHCPDVLAKKCTTWERMTGDAGWGGIVAERAEKGTPVSIIFSLEHNSHDLLALMSEALALLPSSVRWRVSFSTYFMQSHEPILIKCILANADQVVQKSPNTLWIDLRQQQMPVPAGKYVESARGVIKKTPATVVPQYLPMEQAMGAAVPIAEATCEPQLIPGPLGYHTQAKGKNKTPATANEIERGFSTVGSTNWNNGNSIGQSWWSQKPLVTKCLIFVVGFALIVLVLVAIGLGLFHGLNSLYAQNLELLQQPLVEEKFPIEPGELKKALIELKTDRDVKGKKIVEYEEKLNNLDKQLKDVTVQKNKITTERNNLQTDLKSMTDERNKEKAEKNKVIAERDDEKKKNEELTKQLTEANTKKNELQQQLLAEMTTVRRLQEKLSKVTTNEKEILQNPMMFNLPVPPQGNPSQFPTQPMPQPGGQQGNQWKSPAQQQSDFMKQQGREQTNRYRQGNR